jgi:hypothetical protein
MTRARRLPPLFRLPRFFRGAIFATLILLGSAPLTPLETPVAHAAETGRGVWFGQFVQGRFSENWGWYLELQNRLMSGWDALPGAGASSPNLLETRHNRLILRPALRFLPTGSPSFQLAFGHGWTPNLSPSRDEHRLWQQVLLQTELSANLQLSGRVRFEQRWIEGAAQGVQHRIRLQGRSVKRLSPTVAFVAWDELFWGFSGGFDQNRIFLGPQFQLLPGVRIEPGYLQILMAQGSQRDSQLNHILNVFTFVEL